MINNITHVDPRMQQQMGVAKASTSHMSIPMPAVVGFKTPSQKEKALIRIQKFKRADNIVIVGDIDDDYVDIIEEKEDLPTNDFNFFQLSPEKKKTKFLKNTYVIDYIQSPVHRCGMGTAAIKSLAEKSMFDPRTEGRIVTFCTPVHKESSPAQFFYKLGFRFMDVGANEYIRSCIEQKMPDTPPQIGMMYLPKSNLHKLLRYGDLF